MSDPIPSTYDVIYRWPKALTAISALSLAGDKKYNNDGRPPGRGSKLDGLKYTVEYSSEKLHRHDSRIADGELFDSENGHPHYASRAWHALNSLEVWLEDNGYTLQDILEEQHVGGR